MRSKAVLILFLVLLLGATGAVGWAQDEDVHFWRLRHMDGPHDSSKAQGESRDGKVAVGSTLDVDFQRARSLDIDRGIATDDGLPPLFNELQAQEDIGTVVLSPMSTADAASDVTCISHIYDKSSNDSLKLGWCGSTPVGSLGVGTVSYAAQWLLPASDSLDEGEYCTIPDFGGGLPEMQAVDVSAEGSIIAGYGNTERGLRGRRADTAVVGEDEVSIPVQLETRNDPTEQTLRSSSAQAVSADGTIIDG